MSTDPAGPCSASVTCTENGVGRNGRPNGASASNVYRPSLPLRCQYGSVTRGPAGIVSAGSQGAPPSSLIVDIATAGAGTAPPPPRPPPKPNPPPVNAVIAHAASPSNPPNVTCFTVTSAAPRLATMTFTFTGWPGTTTPAAA